MKNFCYTIIFGLMMPLTSCNFLETDTYDYLDESDLYQTEESCKAGLAGVYDVLGAIGCYGLNLWGDLDGGTDIMVYNRDNNSIHVPSYNYNHTDNALKVSWIALYDGINRANNFIQLIESRTDEECGGSAKKAMYLGEAKALRAVFYLNLVAFWGEVPLRLTPNKDLSNQLQAKATQKEIYAQIIADLKDAEESCLSARDLDTPGRISQTTAQALLARAYLWQSGYPVQANTWKEALEYARKVRDSRIHRLHQQTDGVNGYHALFIKMCSNQYDLATRESMFEVEFYGNGLEQTNETGRLGLYNGVQQQNASDDHAYAYGFYDGTKYLFSLYEAEDARRWWNIADYSYSLVDGVVTEVPRSTSAKDGNCAKWRAKYIPERPLAHNNSSINFPIMRYSDVLLMIAECANELEGVTDEAITAINQIRTRAGASTIEAANFNQESFRQFIRDERTRELCYEVPRRMELRRHGVAYFRNQLNILRSSDLKLGYDPDNVRSLPAYNFADKHIYFPIPQSELNVNTLCEQAQGW